MPSVSPSVPPRTAPAAPARHGSRVPTHGALSTLLQQEQRSELELVRRGESAVLARIEYLKAANAALERQNELFSSALAAQSELLHDVSRKVSKTVQLVGTPQSLQGSPMQHVAVELLQIQQRIAKGAGGAAQLRRQTAQ